MQWEVYKKAFIRKAKAAGFEEPYINSCLNYAFNLFDQGLPVIYDDNHLSLLVGYELSYLLRASNSQQAFYRNFNIKKKSGKLRKISEPLPSLKEIQRWILDNILEKIVPSRFAKAFIKKRSIKDNARFHRNQKFVLSIDVENFFPSIKFNRVYHLFRSIGYSNSVSTILSNLCTLDDCLPQGAPTSPAISNIVCLRLDGRLSGYALRNKIRYTRYADDITFSGTFNPGRVFNLVRMVLTESGFKINSDKTRLMEQHQRQEVTGIVVNKKLQTTKELRRYLRQNIYYIKKYGLESHLSSTNNKKANYLSHLKGVAGFVYFVNNKDLEAKEAKEYLKTFG